MCNNIIPVIIAGGSGSRLWPLSRKNYPKQFLNILGENSFIQETIERLKGLDRDTSIIISNENHRFLAAEQLRKIGETSATLILEPEGRNTAPAITLSALQALKEGRAGNSLLLVLASDHYIESKINFQKSILQAVETANSGYLVTFGVVPTRAETGYGYIKKGERVDDFSFRIDEFKEKPNADQAILYLNNKDYLWNSGMFMMRIDVYLNALEKHAPEILRACNKAINNSSEDLDFLRVDASEFNSCPNISIDYAVLEKEKNAAVVPLDAGWNDIGSWTSLWKILDKDKNKNVKKGDVIVTNCSNSFVFSDSRLVAAVGVDNLIIVETKDAVLVVNKEDDQQVKEVVEYLNAQNRTEQVNHREVYRPWGKYDSIDMEERYQVKRITVAPGQKLSVQMHYHRAEHWIVVSGTALVGIGDKERLISENESVYIPLGEKHFLHNPGKISLELIEIQSGTYLGEDDIVRFDDIYGR